MVRLAATLAASALVAPAHAGAAPRAAPTGAFFGINAQVLVNEFPRSAWTAPLDTAAAHGLRVIRTDAPWHRAEPQSPRNGVHAFRWESLDAVAAELAARGVRWLPVLAYSAPWAASFLGHFQSGPRDPAEFAAFAGAFARRYGRGGAFWEERPDLPSLPVLAYEIWNEPNLPQFWVPYPAPARYAELYLAAREELHAVDPRAVALVGGLAASGSDSATGFLRDMYVARPALRDRVDAIGLHPYDAAPERVAARVAVFRAALDRLGGVDVPIVVTEFGWSTGGIGRLTGTARDDTMRADLLARTTNLLARGDCGVAGVLPHTLVTRESDPLNAEHWYGLVGLDGTARESAHAYAGATRRLTAVTTDGPVDLTQCDRKLTVVLEHATHHRPARRRAPRMVCQSVQVRLAGRPTAGTTVEFEFRRRRAPRRHTTLQVTDRAGVARACFAAPRRGRRATRLVGVTASRPDVIADAVLRLG